MPRGPRTPAEVRVKVVEVLLELREKLQEDPTAKEVREALRKELERAKSPHALPSLRQIQAILTQARRNSALSKDKDGPWSLAISQAHGIPSDANGVLLEMWGYCLTMNKKLTIRQAQWMERLRGVPAAGGSHDRFYIWACLYAGREKASLLAEQEVDTTDLDAFLAFDKKSHGAAVRTRAVPDVTRFIEDIAEVDPILATFGLGSAPSIAIQVLQGHLQQQQANSITAPLHQLQQDIISQISPLEVATGIITTVWNVWRLWAIAFFRSGKLYAMSETEQSRILQELASEIADWFRSTPPLSPHLPDMDDWIPSRKLLTKLGYQNQDQP
jgi:hypothetical protein